MKCCWKTGPSKQPAFETILCTCATFGMFTISAHTMATKAALLNRVYLVHTLRRQSLPVCRNHRQKWRAMPQQSALSWLFSRLSFLARSQPLETGKKALSLPCKSFVLLLNLENHGWLSHFVFLLGLLKREQFFTCQIWLLQPMLPFQSTSDLWPDSKCRDCSPLRLPGFLRACCFLPAA